MFCILNSKCHSCPNPTVHCTKVVVSIDTESAQGCRAVDSLQRSLLNLHIELGAIFPAWCGIT